MTAFMAGKYSEASDEHFMGRFLQGKYTEQLALVEHHWLTENKISIG